MNFTIFSKLVIDDKSEESALSEIKKYQQLASQISRRYQSLHTIFPLLEDDEEIESVGLSFNEYSQQFSMLSQEVNKFIGDKERNINRAIENIRKYDDIFNNIEPIYQKHKDKIASSDETLQSCYQGLKLEQAQYINDLNANWAALQNKLSEQIEKGIESLLEVKLTLGITGAFKDQITREIKNNRRSGKIYFSLFVITLILIPISIGSVYFIEKFKDLEWTDLFLIKISIVIPLIWLARWFSKNYAHARLASIKFDHLNRLLGEGASTIAKLVEADTDAKSEVYRRFAELFLDIKDLEGIAVNQPKHPIEDLKEIIEIQNKLSK